MKKEQDRQNSRDTTTNITGITTEIQQQTGRTTNRQINRDTTTNITGRTTEIQQQTVQVGQQR